MLVMNKTGHIQGDSGRNVSDLEGNTFGHSEKKNSYEHVSDYE
jgi:hypothetical protein